MSSRRPQPVKLPYAHVRNDASVQAVGLLGWWPGSGAGGALWDLGSYIGNGNLVIGTMPTGGRFVTGVNGFKTAVTYDGGTNRTTLVNSNRYFGSNRNAISISLWVKTSNISNYNYLLVNWGTANTTDSFHLRLDITTGFPYFTHSSNSNYTSGNDLNGVTNCADGKWHHIVATHDSVPGITNIFVDGKLDATKAAIGAMAGLSASLVTMGGLSDGNLTGNWLNGAIDDPRIYSYAMPLAVVDHIYNPLTRRDLIYQPSRKVYYPPTQNASATTTDSPTSSDTVTRTLSGLRTGTDSPTTSESASRILGAHRVTTDSPTLADSATYTSVVGDVTFDHVTLSESVIVTAAHPRTTTDAPTVSEAATVIIVAPRTTIDAPTTSENVQRVGSFHRQTTDTPTLSETATRSEILSRTTIDSPTVSESVTVGNYYAKTATDSPSTAESISTNHAATKTGTDASTISESLSTQKILFKSVSQSLTITHSNLVGRPNQDVSQGLTISQTVNRSGSQFAKSRSNNLSIIQVADYFKFKPIAISQSLTITQSNSEVVTNGFNSALTVTQSVAYQYDPHFGFASQVLTPTQVVSKAAIFARTISQPLVITQIAAHAKIITRSIISTLGLHQEAIDGVSRSASNTLTLAQTVAVAVFRNPSTQNTLHVTQAVHLQMNLNRSLISTLVFLNEHQIPNGSGGFINVPNLILTRGGSALINCNCQSSSATTVFQSRSRAIILPNPEYNDTENLVAAVSIKRTITGGTFSYVKRSSNRKLKYRFLISQRKAYELRQFLLDFLGDRISMTNFRGEMWSGYLLSDPAEITSNMRGDPCIGDLYEVNLEYQGVRVN